VLGTVEGDVHDIGINLVGMMLEGAGFEVLQLGADTSAEDFIQAIRDTQADILGMSALLTTTMVKMKTVIESLKEERCKRQSEGDGRRSHPESKIRR